MSKKKISILGSTGSIGVSALDVIGRHPDRFDVVALSAGDNIALLAAQIDVFAPKLVSVRSAELVDRLKAEIRTDVEIVSGASGAVQVATLPEADIVLSAIVGAAGLKPTYSAVCKGKTIALANKETLVAAGKLMMSAAEKFSVKFLPVDSEHSAVFQSLQGHRKEDLTKIILTASGGPFRNFKGDLSKVTVADALNHPNWSMGKKITIDSATMMNKSLEIIEAHWLFGVPSEQIDVVIHPESIVHSMVEYRDGSVVAQMGRPDMRAPIAYALAFPERIESNVLPVDWKKLGSLNFSAPDHERFPMLCLARQAIRASGSVANVMNAANEIAVAAFLDGKIRFTDIYKVVAETISAHTSREPSGIEDVLAVDAEGRRIAEEITTKLPSFVRRG